MREIRVRPPRFVSGLILGGLFAGLSLTALFIGWWAGTWGDWSPRESLSVAVLGVVGAGLVRHNALGLLRPPFVRLSGDRVEFSRGSGVVDRGMVTLGIDEIVSVHRDPFAAVVAGERSRSLVDARGDRWPLPTIPGLGVLTEELVRTSGDRIESRDITAAESWGERRRPNRRP